MVKRLFGIVFLMLGLQQVYFSQTASYANVKSLLETYLDGASLDNKLLVLQVWSVNSPASREQNQALDKTFYTYQHAKLKGGAKGMAAITLCLDNGSNATIAYTKDGMTHLKSIAMQEVSSLQTLTALSATYNIVFDNTGQKLYEALPANKWFSSIQQLITR